MISKSFVFVTLATMIVMPVAAAESTGVRVRVEERLKLRQERVEQRRVELKTRLQNIHDTRRKELVERLHERMCNVQQNRVAAQKRQLQSLTNILDRVEERAKVTAEVETARSAIAAAQTAVNALEERDCGLTVSGEEAELRGEVRAAQQALTAQVKAVHQKIVTARKAVGEAIRALAKVLGEPLPSPVLETKL